MKILKGLTPTSEKASLLRFWCLTVLIQLLIDLAPTRKSSKVAIVDEEVCMDFSTYIRRVRGFFRIRSVDCIWRYALVLHEFNCVLKLGAVAVGPKDKPMAIVLKHSQGFNRKRLGLANGGVFIFDNGPVKVYCYEETLTHLLF